MLLSTSSWAARQTELALSEGWMVFNDCEIQRDDEASKFGTDEDAIAHVRARAAEGSATHQLAMAIHDANN
jgi:hypothetical protein